MNRVERQATETSDGAGGETENKPVGGDASKRPRPTEDKAADEGTAGGREETDGALDRLLGAVGSEGKAAFDYASDVINETADRAEAAVEKSRLGKRRRQRRESH